MDGHRVRGRTHMGVVALAVVLGLLAPACGGGSSDKSEKTGIDVMVSGDPEELQAFRDVVSAFEDKQDAIDVNLIEIADRDEMIARLATSIGGGQAPDLFLMNYRYVGQFQAAGGLEPLGTYLDGSSVLSEDAFYPEALDAFRYDGTITCLPQNASSLVLYYNEDLLEKAGLEPPTAGWKWNEMVSHARAMTSKDVYGLGVDPEVLRIAPFIWSNGGELVDNDEDPTAFTLTTPLATEAMQRFFFLRQDGLTPTDVEAESEDFESRFINGRLGMFMESRKVVPALRTITDFGWDVAPLPVMQEPATVLHSDAYCLTTSSENPDEAWTFLEFALGEEGQRIAAATGRTVPSLKSVAESEAFLDPTAEPQNSQAFLDSIPIMRRVPNTASWPEIEDTANGLIEEGYYTNASAVEVAAEVQMTTKPMFTKPTG